MGGDVSKVMTSAWVLVSLLDGICSLRWSAAGSLPW